MNSWTECAEEECRVKSDFLPFLCLECHLYYCDQHRRHHATCQQDQSILLCPTCQQRIIESDSINTLQEHIESICTLHIQPFSLLKTVECHVVDCTIKQFYATVCVGCRKLYCVKHRHPFDHQCPFQQESQLAKAQKRLEIQSFLSQSLTTTSTDTINTTTKNTTNTITKNTNNIPSTQRKKNPQVELMRMKMHALGNTHIPLPKRVYFQVHLPANESPSPTSLVSHKYKKYTHQQGFPVFVQGDMTMGKYLDCMADMAGIVNENNKGIPKKASY